MYHTIFLPDSVRIRLKSMKRHEWSTLFHELLEWVAFCVSSRAVKDLHATPISVLCHSQSGHQRCISACEKQRIVTTLTQLQRASPHDQQSHDGTLLRPLNDIALIHAVTPAPLLTRDHDWPSFAHWYNLLKQLFDFYDHYLFCILIKSITSTLRERIKDGLGRSLSTRWCWFVPAHSAVHVTECFLCPG